MGGNPRGGQRHGADSVLPLLLWGKRRLLRMCGWEAGSGAAWTSSNRTLCLCVPGPFGSPRQHRGECAFTASSSGWRGREAKLEGPPPPLLSWVPSREGGGEKGRGARFLAAARSPGEHIPGTPLVHETCFLPDVLSPHQSVWAAMAKHLAGGLHKRGRCLG